MALISCPECQAQVSDKALICQQCGVQIRKPKRSLLGKICKWVFILFNVLMVVSVYNTIATAPPEVMNDGASMAGYGIGVGIIVVIWALGSIILGFLALVTRAK